MLRSTDIPSNMVDSIAQAIAGVEGFYLPSGSIAQRNRNPGNLRSWGSFPVVGGYAKFPTYEHGWSALRRQIELLIGRNMTLQEFFAGKPGVYPGYAPTGDGSNNPHLYAQMVSQRTGIPIDVPLVLWRARWSQPARDLPRFIRLRDLGMSLSKSGLQVDSQQRPPSSGSETENAVPRLSRPRRKAPPKAKKRAA